MVAVVSAADARMRIVRMVRLPFDRGMRSLDT